MAERGACTNASVSRSSGAYAAPISSTIADTMKSLWICCAANLSSNTWLAFRALSDVWLHKMTHARLDGRDRLSQLLAGDLECGGLKTGVHEHAVNYPRVSGWRR